MRPFITLSAALAMMVAAINAQAFEHRHVHCPHCSTPCYPSVSIENEKKNCWEIECKKVCIPRVTFPWQQCKKDCCNACPMPAKCGRVRTVRVLVPHEYECPTCKYKWEVPDVDCCRGGCNSPDCSHAACTSPDAIPPQSFEYGDPAPLPPAVQGAIEPVHPQAGEAEPTTSVFQTLLRSISFQ